MIRLKVYRHKWKVLITITNKYQCSSHHNDGVTKCHYGPKSLHSSDESRTCAGCAFTEVIPPNIISHVIIYLIKF